MEKKRKEEWTSDPREIERRMIRAGVLKSPLIWGPEGLKVVDIKKKRKLKKNGKA